MAFSRSQLPTVISKATNLLAATSRQPMNYRHAYHAGNAGDVLKHAVLAFVLDYLRTKAAPFFVLDTHAGIGVYDFASQAARKTEEWRAGVGRLLDDRPAGAAGDVLLPWYRTIDALDASRPPRRYPGSPEIVRAALRPQDRAVFCELHPADARALGARYRSVRNIEVVTVDGWTALQHRLPPRERRGLVLVDPPFEDRADYGALSDAVRIGHRRFATGLYMLWYPVKGTADARGLARALAETRIPKMLRVELYWRTPNHPGRLDGAGLIIVNPPWTLPPALESALPVLAERLAVGPGAGHVMEWLTDAQG